MTGFVLYPEAYADLEEIWEFIAADSPEAADRLLDEFHEAINSLVPFPRQGHVRPDLTSRPLRFHVVREYLIVYAPEEKPVAIMAILHGRRHPKILAALLNARDI